MAHMKDKSCIVTGGARGISYAICKAFADEGTDVLLTDIDEPEGRKAARDLGCAFAPLDVRSEAQWDRIAARLPYPDVVVNNAGSATSLG